MRRTHLAALVTLLVTAGHAAAQDPGFIRGFERAQQERPASIGSVARIAPESEPGVALVIHGRAVADDGSTPLANAIVFAYHTDSGGLYDHRGSPPHSWRLKGWARTDAEGKFEFRTIRPGSYPNTNNPPHVHFSLITAEGRFHAGELQFDGDRGIRREGRTEHVDFTARHDRRQRF